MTVRERFDEELGSLQNKLKELCSFAANALEQSLIALENYDVKLAEQIIKDDVKANIMYEEIHDSAILLIAKQQPVAIDLRKIMMALKISTELERIADFAENISKSAIRIGKKIDTTDRPYQNIKKMLEIGKDMLKESIESFINEDTQLAKKVADMDDQVDALNRDTIETLFKMNQENPNDIPEILQLLLVSRYLERAADHITNIAENVFYLVKGKHYDLNE